ncbi:MAG: phosphoenolpyruvate--protein phosphotransferase, partial [Verrucomicrobia bacterium]|nr:phosphoenolpyruvate--protein phosphotransferase [Verrucomicrobiota bacterium]
MIDRPRKGELTLRGIPVSAGIARGKVLILGRGHENVPDREIHEREVSAEVARFEQSLVETRQQIQEIQRRVSTAMGAQDASIFEAHLLVLEDPMLIEEVSRVIADDLLGAESAFQRVADRYAESLGKVDDEYLRERVSDLRDVTTRVLHNLLERPDDALNLRQLKLPCIIVSHDLSPSTTALLDRQLVLGFA